MKRSKAVFYVLAALLISCQPSEKPNQGYTTIPIDEAKLNEEYLLSDLIEITEVIPLENDPLGILSSPYEIIVTNENIYVRDDYRHKVIVIFSRTGEYVNRIVGTGKGPEEVHTPTDIAFNQYTNQLMVLDLSQKKVVCFDPEGNYRSHFKTEFFAHCMENIGDSLIVFFTEIGYNLYVTNNFGQELYHQFEYDPTFQMGSTKAFLKKDDAVYFNRWLDDTIYQVSSERAIPAFVADFGNRKLTRERYRTIEPSGMGDRLIPSGVLYNFQPLGITDEHLLFYFGSEVGNIGIYNLNTKTVLISAIQNIQYDLTNGIYPLSPGGTFGDSLFIGCIQLSRLDKPTVFHFKDRELTVDPEDNPIVFLYKFKI